MRCRIGRKENILGSSLLYLLLTDDKMTIWKRQKIPTQAHLYRKTINGTYFPSIPGVLPLPKCITGGLFQAIPNNPQS